MSDERVPTPDRRRTDVAWDIEADSADFLDGPLRLRYGKPLVLATGEVINMNAPNPFDKSARSDDPADAEAKQCYAVEAIYKGRRLTLHVKARSEYEAAMSVTERYGASAWGARPVGGGCQPQTDDFIAEFTLRRQGRGDHDIYD